MTNLTDVIEVFRNLSERENETMFAQGKLLAEAIEAGMKPKDITRECGIAAGKSSQTMLNRLKVGLIFGDDYCKDMDWSVHLIAATAPNVDYRDPYTHMYARAVIDTAIKGYVDNNGVHRPHTARTLKATIRAAAKPASGKPKAGKRPTIVCLCGSTRFSEAFQQANLNETLAGRIVLTIGCDMKADHEIFEGMSEDELTQVKADLDKLHFSKIDLADEVLILNVGNYIGQSTTRELAYAEKLGKRVRYLETRNPQPVPSPSVGGNEEAKVA